VVQKRAEEGEVVLEAFMRSFRGITSHWLSPGLTALQAGVLQRIA
jgi:DNA-binding HxlR family transcriptional regulator